MDDLLILLEVYWVSIVAASFSGILLAQLEVSWPVVISLCKYSCLSQGALSGVLLGLFGIMAAGGEEALHASIEGHSFSSQSFGFGLCCMFEFASRENQ